MRLAVRVLLLVAILVGCGCHRGEADRAVLSESAAKPSPISAEERLTGELHAGLYQIGAALEELKLARGETQTAADEGSRKLADPLAEVLDGLDDVGATLAEVNLTEPTEEEVRAAMIDAEDRKKALLDTIAEALTSVEDVQGILDTLPSVDPKETEHLKSAAKHLDGCHEALTEAVLQMGGNAASSKSP